MLGKPGIRIPIREVVFKDTGVDVLSVNEKIAGSSGWRPGFRRVPFMRQGAPIVPGRVLSLLKRHRAAYMRYE